MRGQPTEYENKLAAELRRRGLHVVQQHPFYYGGRQPFHADLVIPHAKLVIEVDGSHHTRRTKQVLSDVKRDNTMRRQGYEVWHVSNGLVYSDSELQSFADQIAGQYPPPPPPRPPTATTKRSPKKRRKKPKPRPIKPTEVEVTIGKPESAQPEEEFPTLPIPPDTPPLPIYGDEVKKRKRARRKKLIFGTIVLLIVLAFLLWPKIFPPDPVEKLAGWYDRIELDMTVPEVLDFTGDFDQYSCNGYAAPADDTRNRVVFIYGETIYPNKMVPLGFDYECTSDPGREIGDCPILKVQFVCPGPWNPERTLRCLQEASAPGDFDMCTAERVFFMTGRGAENSQVKSMPGPSG